MEYSVEPDWRERMLPTALAMTTQERVDLARRSSRGELARVARGVYLPRSTHARVRPESRHRYLVQARVLTGGEAWVFSHASAGALWRLPRLGAWPTVVHVVAPRESGGRSTPTTRRHAVGMPASDVIDSIHVTTLPRTVVDLAREDSWENAVVAADAALAGYRLGAVTVGTTQADLLGALDDAPRRGTATARSAIAFADGHSGSPGESVSRVSIARSGLTAPVLQSRFDDDTGAMFVDFWWPDVGVVGEFDGLGKYLRAEWMDGRTTAQVVVDEKWREDRLRRQVSGVVRWGWDVARSPSALGRLLRSAGVR